MQLGAFNPQGNTVAITAAASPPAGVQVPLQTTSSPQQYVFYNAGTVDAFMGYGADATTAQTNSVTPTGTGQRVVVVPAKMMVTYTLPGNSFISGVASVNATVYVTPGEGV